MKQIKNTIALIVCFLLCGSSLFAQSLRINMQQGSSTQIDLNDIRKITFGDSTMNLYKRSSAPVVSYNYTQVGSLTFSETLTGLFNVRPMENKLDITVYPNPNNGEFNVDILLSQKSNGTSIQLYNMNGELVFNEQDKVLEQGANTLSFDFKNTKSGFYFLKVRSGEMYVNKKILITN